MSNIALKIGISTLVLACLFSFISCNTSSEEALVSSPNIDTLATVTHKAPAPDSSAKTQIRDTPTTTKQEVSQAVASKSETHVITIDDMKFSPSTITIKKGDKVTFKNNDIVAHNATEINKAWASPLLDNGKSFTCTPKKTSDYYCTIHVVMKGKIIVE